MTNNKAYDVSFEKAGVIFRGVVSCINKRIIIDYIDVKPGVNTVYFDHIQPDECVPFNTAAIEFSPQNKDSFPWVKTLHIGSAVKCINISNQMFPNVKSVVSDNALFETRDMLVEHNRLLNSFYKRNDDILDMKGIKSIWPNALNGCMTKRVINTNDLDFIYEKSFCGYEPLIDPKTGTKLFGDVIVELNDKTEILEFPDDRYDIRILNCFNRYNFNKKSIKIHSLQTLKNLIGNNYLMPNRLIIDLKNDNTEAKHDSLKLMETLKSGYVINMFSEIEVLNSSYFKSEDGIVYTNDGEVLVYCPRLRQRKVNVKKGTRVIAEDAFKDCKKIESVVLPDTIEAVQRCAFMNCQSLKSINLNEGIKTIGHSCFYECWNLKEIEIPSSVSIIPAWCFRGCPLESIKLSEGVTGINEYAFNVATRTLTVPESLVYVDKGNFDCLEAVTLKKNRFPSGLLCRILTSCSQDCRLTKVVYKNDTFYIPHIAANLTTAQALESHPIEVIKNNIHVFLEDIPSRINKVIYGLEIYEKTKDENVEPILKAHSASFLKYQIKEKQEETVIRFVKTGIVQPNVLKMALKMTEDNNMTTASAYILNALKDQTDKTNFDI